jgi:hypothetical protein
MAVAWASRTCSDYSLGLGAHSLFPAFLIVDTLSHLVHNDPFSIQRNPILPSNNEIKYLHVAARRIYVNIDGAVSAPQPQTSQASIYAPASASPYTSHHQFNDRTLALSLPVKRTLSREA